jgi:hypothetical protein
VISSTVGPIKLRTFECDILNSKDDSMTFCDEVGNHGIILNRKSVPMNPALVLHSNRGLISVTGIGNTYDKIFRANSMKFEEYFDNAKNGDEWNFGYSIFVGEIILCRR